MKCCKKCSAVIDDNARFCPHCGGEVVKIIDLTFRGLKEKFSKRHHKAKTTTLEREFQKPVHPIKETDLSQNQHSNPSEISIAHVHHVVDENKIGNQTMPIENDTNLMPEPSEETTLTSELSISESDLLNEQSSSFDSQNEDIECADYEEVEKKSENDTMPLKAENNSIIDTNKAVPEREFDLNIEKILEDWEVFHAIREIIANAIDEQTITQTDDISIFETGDNCWHITDYGRGLHYKHLTQNENEEKLKNDKLIGKFGVGLKDALATLYRNDIKVTISSRFGVITLKQTAKAGFDDIITLHAEIGEPEDENMVGTEFCLYGCQDSDIEKAKALFLKFTKHEIMESTCYGDVIKKREGVSNIYINGVKVAEEPNFIFSYNITSLTSKLKKALNRERTNVGRTAYTDRIKAILLECQKELVIRSLMNDVQQFAHGTMHDELTWKDVQLYASKKITEYNKNVMFVTAETLETSPNFIDDVKSRGYSPVVVSNSSLKDMQKYNMHADDEDKFATPEQVRSYINDTFQPIIIDFDALTAAEQRVYEKTDQILNLIGGKPEIVKEIKIAERIYIDEGYDETVGVWQLSEQRILIKRSQLRLLSSYAGVLLHECAHASSLASDVSREFELELTEFLGIIASKMIRNA